MPTVLPHSLEVTTHDLAPGDFGAFVAEQRLPMLRLARFLLGRRGPAEDIVHDAFVRVFTRFDKVANPAGYLRTCVVNGCRSHRRRTVVLQRITPLLRPAPAVAEADYLLDAVAALPYRQRVAVVLRYYEDLSQADIANVLGCSIKAAESLTAHGVTALRARITRGRD